jgi:predicted transcriptional regulator
MAKVNVSIRLDKDSVAILDELAHHDDRDRSYLIKKAIESYIKLRQWQIEDIKKALAEAEAGEFLSDEEAEAFMEELGR